MLEGHPEAQQPTWICSLKALSGISGLMKATKGPGENHESRFPLYARGLSRGKYNVPRNLDSELG